VQALGRYRLVAEIGRGGMAEVFLAVAQGTAGFQKLLVVKALAEGSEDEPEHLTMFLDEARLAARMHHPHIVATHEVGEDRGRHFLVMEWLDGQPLHKVLARMPEGALPLPHRVRILCDTLSALHYAHELTDFDGTPLGIVHRDVSPQNVVVTFDGTVKLVDFGIAKASLSSTETQVGILKGKVAYMAPEQARGERVDRRADVFAVGMMLWEVLVGRRMWKGKTDREILEHVFRGEMPSVEEARPDAPPGLASICARALALDPVDRYPTAAAMQRDLEKVLRALGPLPASDLGDRMQETFAEMRARTRTVIEERLRGLSPDASTSMVAPLSLPSTATESLTSEEVTRPSVPRALRNTGRTGIAQTLEPVPTPKRRRPVWPWAVAAGLFVLALPTGWYATRTPPTVAGAVERPVAALGSATPNTPAPTTAPTATPSGACGAKNKPLVEINGDIDGDFTLSCANDYLLKFLVFVKPGATLTIEPGTVIHGDPATKATLVVQPGGKLVARGKKNEPIVFTSAKAPSERRPGDWGGVILLGRAPLNLRDEKGQPQKGRIEGITQGGLYGGDDPDDDSGVLEYVRIEYSGVVLGPNNEINGLTLGAVGRKTVLDHILVRQTADDCFEFFGGTVDGKHLVCQYGGDDGFDWDYGYRGRLQFLFLQQDPSVVDDTNGFEGDNDPAGSANEPRSEPTIWNATLCGMNKDAPKEQYGMLFRRGTRGHVWNTIVTGFEAGLDVRDKSTRVEVRSSIFFKNPIAHVEKPGPFDDDDGFDEVAFVLDPSRKNLVMDPKIPGCFDPTHPRPGPLASLTANAATPPADGFFDPKAAYVGAFRDEKDDWATGEWIAWGSR